MFRVLRISNKLKHMLLQQQVFYMLRSESRFMIKELTAILSIWIVLLPYLIYFMSQACTQKVCSATVCNLKTIVYIRLGIYEG